MPVTRVEPSTKLFDPARTFRYTNAANTDIAKRFKAMQAKAQELIAQIGEGSLAEAAAKAGVQVQALAALPRGVPVPGAEANAAIFRATPPVDGKPVYGTVAMDDGRHAVFALTKVTPGDVSEVPEAQRGLLTEQLSQIDGNNAAEAYIRGMRERFKIQVSEDQL